MSINLSYIYIISFILTFFPMFVLYIKKGTNGNIYISLLLLVILYLLFIVYKPNYFKKFLTKFLSIPTTKYYLTFLGFVILSLTIHIILGHYGASIAFYAVRIYKFFVATILVYLLPLLGLMIGIKFKNILKLFILIIWFICFVSIIQYLSFLLEIKFLIYIFDFFTNARTALYLNSLSVQEGLRAYAFFSEPSALGQFIFLIMPFAIIIPKTKELITQNKLIDWIIKKTFIPFMLLAVIFTKSPIFLVLCLIEFPILLFINNWGKIKKYLFPIITFIVCFLLFSSLILILYKNQLEQTYIFRIFKTIYSFGDYNKLVLLEPSLATRIFSYSIQLVAFLKVPIFGCGLNNAEFFVNPFYLSEAPLPLTPENFYLGYLHNSNLCSLNRSIVYTSLAEFGLVGFSIYLFFIIKNIKFLTNIKNYFIDFEYNFLIALIQTFITTFIISFYNLSIDNAIVWLIYGFAIIFIIFYRHNAKGIQWKK